MEKEKERFSVLVNSQNYSTWVDDMKLLVMSEYGLMWKILMKTKPGRDDHGAQVQVPMTVEDVFPAPQSGGSASERGAAAEELKEIAKLRVEARANLSKVTGLVLRSVHSSVLIKMRADPRYENAVDDGDLATLWRLIRDVVLGSPIARESQGIAAREGFSRVYQGSTSLEDYVDRIVKAARLAEIHGVVIPESERIHHFLMNLDRDKFGGVVADWITEERVPASFAGTVVKVTEWSRAKESFGRQVKKAASEPAGRGMGGTDAVFGVNPKRKCFYCGERGHLMRDCPSKSEPGKGPAPAPNGSSNKTGKMSRRASIDSLPAW